MQVLEGRWEECGKIPSSGRGVAVLEGGWEECGEILSSGRGVAVCSLINGSCPYQYQTCTKWSPLTSRMREGTHEAPIHPGKYYWQV